jgi:hypothetical protein
MRAHLPPLPTIGDDPNGVFVVVVWCVLGGGLIFVHGSLSTPSCSIYCPPLLFFIFVFTSLFLFAVVVVIVVVLSASCPGTLSALRNRVKGGLTTHPTTNHKQIATDSTLAAQHPLANKREQERSGRGGYNKKTGQGHERTTPQERKKGQGIDRIDRKRELPKSRTHKAMQEESKALTGTFEKKQCQEMKRKNRKRKKGSFSSTFPGLSSGCKWLRR